MKQLVQERRTVKEWKIIYRSVYGCNYSRLLFFRFIIGLTPISRLWYFKPRRGNIIKIYPGQG